MLYPDDVATDNDVETRIAELIREAALDGVRDELPHSIAVTVDELRRRESGLQEVFATIHLERDSQKGIVIGPGGSRLKRIGTTARAGIEDAARRTGPPGAARRGGAGLAARPEEAGPARFLTMLETYRSVFRAAGRGGVLPRRAS